MQIKQSQKKKKTDTSKLVRKSDYNAKVSQIEGKILSINGLATTSVLTAVENKVPSVNNLFKKTDYDTKITETKKNLLISTMTNILQLQILILLQDYHKQI